jgi:hypothetical protein
MDLLSDERRGGIRIEARRQPEITVHWCVIFLTSCPTTFRSTRVDATTGPLFSAYPAIIHIAAL